MKGAVVAVAAAVAGSGSDEGTLPFPPQVESFYGLEDDDDENDGGDGDDGQQQQQGRQKQLPSAAAMAMSAFRKWSQEEVVLVEVVSKQFNQGVLKGVAEGTRLTSFLSSLIGRKPAQLTRKQFSGGIGSLAGQFFASKRALLKAGAVSEADAELKAAKIKYRKGLKRQSAASAAHRRLL